MLIPENRKPTTPGYYIRKYVIEACGIHQGELARRLDVTRKTVNLLINEKSRVTVDMAHRLARLTQTEPEFWLNAQRAVDIWEFRQSASFEKSQHIEPVVA